MKIKERVMKKNANKRLTSVHVDKSDHDKFKHLCVEHKITFQMLVSKVLKKFVDDETFRTKILK